jgi:hypothetical protein
LAAGERRVAADEGEPLEETESQNREERNKAWPRARAGESFFKKPIMGAPDTLQCMSGAHQTAHNSCSVNHRTSHRKKEFCTRATGAPDSAQCSVRCTQDCPVSPDRGNFEIFQNFLSNFQPNQIPTYNHTKEHLLGQVLALSYIFS